MASHRLSRVSLALGSSSRPHLRGTSEDPLPAPPSALDRPGAVRPLPLVAHRPGHLAWMRHACTTCPTIRPWHARTWERGRARVSTPSAPPAALGSAGTGPARLAAATPQGTIAKRAAPYSRNRMTLFGVFCMWSTAGPGRRRDFVLVNWALAPPALARAKSVACCRSGGGRRGGASSAPTSSDGAERSNPGGQHALV